MPGACWSHGSGQGFGAGEGAQVDQTGCCPFSAPALRTLAGPATATFEPPLAAVTSLALCCEAAAARTRAGFGACAPVGRVQ